MNCLYNIHCRFLKHVNVDMFAKEPELYYKRKSKKTSFIGKIISIIFVIIYFAFFAYKLIRMLKKVDITFYDTFTYEENPPSLNLTKENFYGGFALEDPITYDAFIDEGIYIAKAYFKRAERQGETYEWQIKELELEPCKLEKFGSNFQKIFQKKDLKNYYCFKEMDFILEGHFTYDVYSFFYIQFFPCVNTSIKQDCKPLEVIDYYLKNTFVSFEFQDIELTPHNYKTPIRPRAADIYTTVGKKLFKEIHAFYQLVNIETDMDWIGFDEFENFKSEKYVKYEKMSVMSNIIVDDIYATGNSFCDCSIRLSEDVRTERRIYTKLITILGDVGGLMEVIFALFKIISSFSIDILYEISLINNLFSFDINKQFIILKEKEKEIVKNKEILKEEKPKIYNSKIILKKISSKNLIINDNMNTGTRIKLNEDIKVKKLLTENVLGVNFTKKNLPIEHKSGLSPIKSNSKKLNASKNIIVNILKNNAEKKEYFYKKNTNNQEDNNENTKENIINKIKINRVCIYLCFCFTRKKKMVQNFLLDEGMNIISEKLDIFNIFKKMYKYEESVEKEMNSKIIEMSNECKLKLNSINNKL